MISAWPLVNHRLLSCLVASLLILQMKEGAGEADPPHTPKATFQQPNSMQPRLGWVQRCWDTAMASLVPGLHPSARSKTTPLPLLHAPPLCFLYQHGSCYLPSRWGAGWTCVAWGSQPFPASHLNYPVTVVSPWKPEKSLGYGIQFTLFGNHNPVLLSVECQMTSTASSGILFKILYHLLEYRLKTY